MGSRKRRVPEVVDWQQAVLEARRKWEAATEGKWSSQRAREAWDRLEADDLRRHYLRVGRRRVRIMGLEILAKALSLIALAISLTAVWCAWFR